MKEEFFVRILTTAFVLGASLWWAFCVGYHIFSPWYKNPYGRNVMFSAVTTASLYTIISLFLMTGRWPFVFTVLVILLLFWSTVVALQRIALMDRVQRRGER